MFDYRVKTVLYASFSVAASSNPGQRHLLHLPIVREELLEVVDSKGQG